MTGVLQSLFQRFGRPRPQITVVSGLPRSGTSLMMKMLQAGGLQPLTDHVRSADEDNPQGYYEFERVKGLKDGDSAWLDQAQDRAVKIISWLLRFLPDGYDYRVLFMQRTMAEILASQKKMLVRRGENAEAVSDEEMARAFEKHLEEVTRWLVQQPNIQVLYVPYNELLEAPGAHVQAINQFLGGQLDTAPMLQVIDPSLYRQRAG